MNQIAQEGQAIALRILSAYLAEPTPAPPQALICGLAYALAIVTYGATDTPTAYRRAVAEIERMLLAEGQAWAADEAVL